jgi:hypothetical protein
VAERLEDRRLLSAVGLFAQEAFALFPSPYDVPRAQVAADFTGDGRPDIAFTDPADGATCVLPGLAGGRFGPVIRSKVGRAVDARVAIDFTGDGRLDLVGLDGGHVVVLRGRGDGTFVRTADRDVFGPYMLESASLVCADLNRDGRPDVVIANRAYEESTFVLLNRGGSLGVPRLVSGLAFPEGLAAGDFTGDGVVDLATTTPDADGWRQLTIVPGRGDGTFRVARNRALPEAFKGNDVDALHVADFNRDGRHDLLVAGSYEGGDRNDTWGESNVTLMLGKGASAFRAVQVYQNFYGDFDETVPVPQVPAVADLNRDGRPDIVVDNSVLIGRGDGTFARRPLAAVAGLATPGAAAQGPSRPAGTRFAADFTGDGSVDLLEATIAGVTILPGRGDGTFAVATRVAMHAAGKLTDGVVADFNRDGRADVATVSYTSPTLAVALGRGNGTFRTPVTYSLAAGATRIVAGDFNGDGWTDLAVAFSFGTYEGDEPTELRVLRNRGDGGFVAIEAWQQDISPLSLVAADINGDGRDDLIYETPDGMCTRVGRRDGSFGSPVASVGVRGTVLGDVTGDGRADLAEIDADTGQATLYTGSRDGRFRFARRLTTPENAQAIRPADIDSDGRNDIVLTAGSDETLYVLRGLSGGRFATPHAIAGGTLLAAADFDRDGRTDLLTESADLWLGRHDGTFDPPTRIAAGDQGMLVGDVTGDRWPDLLSLHAAGYFTVLPNLARPAYAARGGVAGVVFHDRNRNGRRDPGEAGVQSRLIFADLNRDGRLNHNEPRALTSRTGGYRLAKLPIGRQWIRLQPADESRQTTPRGGGAHTPTILADRLIGGWNFGVISDVER